MASTPTPLRLACVVPAVLALAACTSASSRGTRAGTAPDALRSLTAATTPTQFCADASPGFATYLGQGSRRRCAGELDTFFPRWPHGHATVVSTRKVHGQTVVSATVRPQFRTPTDFYFVHRDGHWELNSVGVYKPS